VENQFTDFVGCPRWCVEHQGGGWDEHYAIPRTRRVPGIEILVLRNKILEN